MLDRTSLLEELAGLLGPLGASAPGESYMVDGVSPQLVAVPASMDEVAAILKLAAARDLAVIPWGGGTLISLGNLPSRYDIALDLRRLSGVLEHEAADLTVTVRAGTTLADLQQHLARSGQFLPLDIRNPEQATIGGLLAANAPSGWAAAYGSARDWVIGMRVATAGGLITRAGGKVVKNVAGYDLCKLYVGSLGTLGVIVEATFKVAPLPQTRATLDLSFSDSHAACLLARGLKRRGLALASAGLKSTQDGAFQLSLAFAGTRAGVERSLHETEALTAAAGANAAPPLLDPEPAELTLRAAVLPTQLPQLIQGLQRLSPRPSLLVQPLSGGVEASWAQPPSAASLIQDSCHMATALGGYAVVERCPPSIKASLDIFGEARADFELMRNIKRQFDPANILSPGRFMGRL